MCGITFEELLELLFLFKKAYLGYLCKKTCHQNLHELPNVVYIGACIYIYACIYIDACIFKGACIFIGACIYIGTKRLANFQNLSNENRKKLLNWPFQAFFFIFCLFNTGIQMFNINFANDMISGIGNDRNTN